MFPFDFEFSVIFWLRVTLFLEQFFTPYTCIITVSSEYIHGLAQDFSISIANTGDTAVLH